MNLSFMARHHHLPSLLLGCFHIPFLLAEAIYYYLLRAKGAHIFPILYSVMSHWCLEIIYNRSIYTIKILKHCKLRTPPPQRASYTLAGQPLLVPHLPIFDKSYLVFWPQTGTFLFFEPTIFEEVP